MQIEGSAEIRVVDSRTNEIKQVIKQTNIITNQGLLELLGPGVAPVGADRRISISTQTTTPDRKKNILTGIIATGYIPSGVASPTLFIEHEPPFGQIQNRIDYINVVRTFNSVGLTDRSSSNNEANVSHSALAYLLLDTPCTQGEFDFIDIFYRIQFLNTNGQGIIVPEARLDFCRSFFGQGFYDSYIAGIFYRGVPTFSFLHLWTSPCNSPKDLYTHLGNGREIVYLFDQKQIPNYFKYVFKFSRALDDSVGQIFNAMLQGCGPDRIPYSVSNFLKKPRAPFQNLFTHSSAATKPFFDSLNLASGSGKVLLDGDWTGKWPEMYKISIVNSGATGTATYKWSVRKHLGFEGNTYTDIPFIDNLFTTHRLIPAPGRHGWKKEDFDVHRFSDTEICQYDETGVSLVDIWTGDYINWDSTTTPALPVTMVRQCAVDTVNKKIYIGCRQTGLWVIDSETNTISHPVLEKCYGIDVGLNNIAIGAFEGKIATSENWSTALPFTYTGISDNNWNRVYYLKADPEHPEGIFAIVCSVGTTNNRQLVWYKSNASVAFSKSHIFASAGDSNGIIYGLGTDYNKESFTNPHLAGNINVIMSTEEFGNPANVVSRNIVGENCYTNNNPNSWYVVDFGSSKEVLIDHLALRHGYNTIDYRIKNFKIQGSNNAVSNSIADLNAATWVDLATFVNDTRMPATGHAWASYVVTPSTSGYRRIRILQNGVNSHGSHYLMIEELEFYGQINHAATPANISVTGVLSASLKPWSASLEVSDIGSFWCAQGLGRLIANSTAVLGIPNLSWPIHTFVHSIWGNDAYYKVSFYKDLIISNTNVLDKLGAIKNSYTPGLNSLGGLTFVLHMVGGMVLVNASAQSGLVMRQLFTDNSFCWENYGWDGTQWVLNALGAKTTHAIAETLGNGVSARFENGNIEPHFFATDFHTQSILNGFFKDNVSTMFYESAWYSKPAEFNYPVQSGAVVPATKTTASPTAQYWRLMNAEGPTGINRGWYFWELIFRDASGADITTGGVPSASYGLGGSYPVHQIFDKNTNTFGGSEPLPVSSWVEYKFASAVNVASLSIRAYNDNTHNVPATKYAVATSTDGKNWAVLQYFSLPVVPTNTIQNVTFDPSLYFEGYHQLLLSAVNNPKFVRLEVQSSKLTNLKLNDQPVATTYVGELLPAIPPAPNEVFISGTGVAVFNPADVGKTFTGTYAVIND